MDDHERASENARLVGIGPCTRCGYEVDALSSVEEGRRPTKDSVIICLACSYVLVIDETPSLGLFVRPPTKEEAQGIYADPEVTRALSAVEFVSWRVQAAERKRREERP